MKLTPDAQRVLDGYMDALGGISYKKLPHAPEPPDQAAATAAMENGFPCKVGGCIRLEPHALDSLHYVNHVGPVDVVAPDPGGSCQNYPHNHQMPSAMLPNPRNIIDEVDHPEHYTKGKIEVIDAIEGLGLTDDWYLGNVIKYIARARHKGSELTDLKKAQWYLNRKISFLVRQP